MPNELTHVWTDGIIPPFEGYDPAWCVTCQDRAKRCESSQIRYAPTGPEIYFLEMCTHCSHFVIHTLTWWAKGTLPGGRSHHNFQMAHYCESRTRFIVRMRFEYNWEAYDEAKRSARNRGGRQWADIWSMKSEKCSSVLTVEVCT